MTALVTSKKASDISTTKGDVVAVTVGSNDGKEACNDVVVVVVVVVLDGCHRDNRDGPQSEKAFAPPKQPTSRPTPR